MSVECERCGATMEFDGDDAYVCPECGAFATVDEDGEIYFNDEDLDYEHVGESMRCPDCGSIMIGVEDGWECDKCGCFVADED